MAKNVTLSFKDSELKELEKNGLELNLTVREYLYLILKDKKSDEILLKKVSLIEERLKKIESIVDAIEKLRSSTDELLFVARSALPNSLKQLARFVSISSDYSLSALKPLVGNEGSRYEDFKAKLIERSEEYSEKIFNYFFKPNG